MNITYLDNNATTCIAPEVLDEMMPYLTKYYGNPSSRHSFSGIVAKKLEEARERMANFLHCSPNELVFTGGGTESDSTAIRSTLLANPDKRHIVTSKVEHPAIKNLFEFFGRQGYRVTVVPVDSDGMLDMEFLKQSFTYDTAIVSIMWANSETGVLFPIEEIAQLTHERGILFHTDAVQAVGKIPMDMSRVPVDFLSFAGHKFHAPKGVGGLFVRKGTKFSPFMIGGHQEHGRRGGTENAASIIGMGKAAELAGANFDIMNTRVRKLRDRLEKTLLEKISHSRVNGHPLYRLPNTSNISFEFVEGESILLMLDTFDICVTSGSACTSGSLEPSHVLRAMGVPFTAAHGSIRFSLSRYTTDNEVDLVIEKLPPIIARLRELSPFWQEK